MEEFFLEQPKRRYGFISGLLLTVAAAAIIFGVYYWMLYAYNVFPFSTNAPSQYDLLAQIVPFAEHFFDVMNGNASLFYSYRVAAGMDIFGTVAYCLCSPFSFIFWLFGEGNVWYAASLMIPVKLACIAASAVIMIKLCFPQMCNAVILPVALLYAFCGYTFVANTYINWMDFLIWLPLAVPAFRSLCRRGKIWPLSLVIAACIYTCFSIACFSMLVSYPVCALYAFLVVEKGKKREYLTKISLCYFCGILLALPIMVPALMAYLASGRNTGFFDSLWNDFSELSYYRKFSYIFSDSLFVLLAVFYFVKTHFSTKESRFLAVAGIVIMMPVLVDECCILMNMGSYMSYALRFGFLNAVYELYVACLVLKDFRFGRKTVFAKRFERKNGLDGGGMPEIAFENYALKEEKSRRFKAVALPQAFVFVLLAALSALVCVIIYEIYCVTRNLEGLDLSFWSKLNSAVESAKAASGAFASSYAHSTGALEGIAILFGTIAVISVPSVILYEARLLSPKLIYPCVLAAVTAQILFYGSTLVCGNVFNPIRYSQYDSLYEQIMQTEELEDYEFRIKDYNSYISDNQGFITKTNAYSVFSSVTDDTNFAFNRVFGMGGNGVNTLKSSSGTLFGNCLIGNKYVFYNSEATGDSARPVLSYDYLTEAAREEYFIMYENTCVFPSAFTVSGGDMGVEDDYDAYFDNMQNLYAFLGGEGEVFTTYTFTERDVSVVPDTDDDTGEEVDVIHVKIHLPVSGDYSFYPGELLGNDNIRYYTGSYSESNLKELDKVKTFTYHNAAPSSYYSVYLVDKTGALTAEDVRNMCSYKVIRKDTVAELSEKLWEREVKYSIQNSVLSTKFTASVSAETEGEYLFLNYVSLNGHTAYVNGKKAELQKNGLNMLVVPLEKGENEVVIEYRSPYITYAVAAAGGVAALLIVVAVLFTGRRGERVIARVKTPIAVAAVLVMLGVVGMFMVFPTGVMFYKLFFP